MTDQTKTVLTDPIDTLRAWLKCDGERTPELTPHKIQQCRIWKWMRPGVLDNTGKFYIYAGAGEYGKHYHATANTVDDAAFIAASSTIAPAVRALIERVEAAERDAARYRWLNLKAGNHCGPEVFIAGSYHLGIDIDAAIDAALAQEKV